MTQNTSNERQSEKDETGIGSVGLKKHGGKISFGLGALTSYMAIKEKLFSGKFNTLGLPPIHEDLYPVAGMCDVNDFIIEFSVPTNFLVTLAAAGVGLAIADKLDSKLKYAFGLAGGFAATAAFNGPVPPADVSNSHAMMGQSDKPVIVVKNDTRDRLKEIPQLSIPAPKPAV